MIDKVQYRYSINIDTSKNSNSASIIEFDVELKFIAVTYAQLIGILLVFRLTRLRGALGNPYIETAPNSDNDLKMNSPDDASPRLKTLAMTISPGRKLL